MGMQQQFKIISKIYNVDDIDLLLEDFKFIKTNKKIEYMNVPFTFDIETSSFYNENGEKQATMYAWVLGINGKCIIGRTWDDALKIFKKISLYYGLCHERKMICFIHNLGYEFQFFRHYFNWINVFANDERKPIKAECDLGIEFRCSYMLSGYNLETIGNNLVKYKVSKKIGDLDYSLLRHCKTPLTDREKGYILNDGLVVMSYIQSCIEQYGNITKLPLTKTGFVRNYCRKECFYNGKHDKRSVNKYTKYHNIMNSLQIKSVQEYEQLSRAFQGGFTHANAFKSGLIIDDVTSYDFTSSYPTTMICEKFPMSSGELITINNKEDFNKNIDLYCCVFDVTFINIIATINYDNPISISKCFNVKTPIVNNGRLVSADSITTTLTEQDFKIIRKFYRWDKMIIKNFRRYKKGYLPTDFIKSILKLYVDKTTLKGVPEKEVEYLASKGMLNSCYGMCVTSIVRDDIIYNSSGEWTHASGDAKNLIESYNKSKNRFLFYAWGVWVTAYARRNLFTGILECGNDYIYSDTDSIKIQNAQAHQEYINNYNNNIKLKLEKAMKFHRLPFDMVCPKTIKGESKLLGVWDFDGHYKRFKTLGAKRYIIETNQNEMHLTVSGINKKISMPYLINKYGSNTNVFNAFNDSLYIPSEYTGKNIHTYLDYEQSGYLIDYTGIKHYYHELSSVHLEGAEYTLSLSDQYINYLLGIREYTK